MGMVITAYIICWLPHVLVIIIQYWWVDILVQFSVHHPTAYDVVTAVINHLLPTFNSCINPLIYCVFSVEFRGACRELVRKWVPMSKYNTCTVVNNVPGGGAGGGGARQRKMGMTFLIDSQSVEQQSL